MPDSSSGGDSSHGDSQMQRDIKRLTRLLREGGYSYGQSKHIFAAARKGTALSPPKRKKKGTPKRLTRSELEAFLEAAYERSGRHGLMMRTLFETGSRMGTFARTQAHLKTS